VMQGLNEKPEANQDRGPDGFFTKKSTEDFKRRTFSWSELQTLNKTGWFLGV